MPIARTADTAGNGDAVWPPYCTPPFSVMSGLCAASLPVIDADRCTDCRECISVCPRDAIFEPLDVCCAKCMKYCMIMEVDCKREKPAIAIDRCDGCGLCLPICPASAITWSTHPGGTPMPNL